MSQVFRLPDLGEGLTEAEIVRWLVAVGDTIEVDQPVVEVETAKALVEVPCPYAGGVVELHAEPGQTRPVGEPLITVQPVGADRVEPAGPATGHGSVPAPAGRATGQPGSDNGTGARSGTAPGPADVPASTGPADVPASTGPTDVPASTGSGNATGPAGSGNVLVGYGTGHGGNAARRKHRLPARSRTSGPPAGPAAPPSSPVAPPSSPAVPVRVPGAVLVISPLVRRLARDHGVDLAALRGTGAGGVIRRADVESAAASPAPPAASPAPPAASPAPPAGPLTPAAGSPAPAGTDDMVIPLRGVRKTVADRLTRSRQEIPEVTIWVDADATALLETRSVINSARPDAPVSLLALLARICLTGLRRYPALNSRVDTDRAEIVQSARVHLGIAAQTDRGLLVPVLRDADRLSTGDLAAALAEITDRARAGALPPDRLTGGTFTLNNYGVFGVDGSTPIINHPEAALFGIGRIVDKPWVLDGQLAVRKVTQLSLTFDHRVCDGGTAGGFLRHVADCVERPALLIAHS